MTKRSDYESARALFYAHHEQCGICNQVDIKPDKLAALNQLCLKGAKLMKDAIVKKRGAHGTD